MPQTLRSATLVVLSALAFGRPPKAGAQSTQPLKYTGKKTQTAITPADAMTRLYIVADDSMMGRRAGSEGGMKGTAYIERELRRLGLVPAGDNGTFFQAVPLFDRALDVASKLSADSTVLVANRDYLPIHPGGIPRSLDGVQVIYAGNTGDTTTLITALQAAGKVVMAAGSTGILGRRYPGAVGFIVPRPDQTLEQTRRFVLAPSTLMKTDTDTASRPWTIIVPASSTATYLGVPMENARPGTVGRTLHGAIRYTATDAPARNVVAIIPGSDPRLKNQYVAFGAHNDHIGTRRSGPLDHDSLRVFNEIAGRIYIARTRQLPSFPGSGVTAEERATIRVNVDSLRAIRPARLDSINNGADDDGSGSVGLLEIAERFAGAKVKPKRSLLFVWHTGEELGLYGSEYFTDHPTVPRDSIVAQLNIDMIGRGEASDFPGGGPDYIQVIGSKRLSTEYGNLIETVNNASKRPFRFDYTFDANGHPEQFYCRSDHYEYARYGIPIVFMSTGGHVDYHQITDEPQYINYPHLARVTSLVADAGERVANLDHRVVVDGPKPDPHGGCRQ
ncbi:MAG: M28 family peptidase [Gemmatimonadales bacterium]